MNAAASTTSSRISRPRDPVEAKVLPTPDPVGVARTSDPAGEAAAGRLDRLVVTLGLHDPLWSADRGSWASRAASLFAPHEAQPLADPRLEALRRYTVLYRSGLACGMDEAAAGDGLTAADLAAARSLVDGRRSGRGS